MGRQVDYKLERGRIRSNIFCLPLAENRQKILSMISSKSKKGLAYAKICRDKSGPELKNCTLVPRPKGSQDKKQNICDQLINDLAGEDTDYINQLILKQERKSRKTDKEPTNQGSFSVLQDRYNSPMEPASIRKTHKESEYQERTSQPSSGKKATPSHHGSSNTRDSRICGGFPEREDFLSQTLIEKPQFDKQWSFVGQINDYLNVLSKQDSARTNKKEPKSHNRQSSHYPSRGDITDNSSTEQEWSVNPSKYNKVLSQLQKTLKINDSLEQKIEYQDRKMEQMSKIIASMCCQMDSLKNQLSSEHRERQKYECVFEDFVQKMEKAKSKSKSKHFVPGHAKRFSHIPSSSELSQDFKLGRSELAALIEERKKADVSYMSKFKDDGYLLKKKGKQPKNRHNEQWRESEVVESVAGGFVRNSRY